MVAGGSWALRFPPPKKIKFVAVVKGDCWLSLEGQVASLRVKTGDVFVLPAERAFVLAGDLNSPQIDGLKLFAGATDKIATVGDGDDFFAVGAHIALDPKRGELLSEVLPPLLHVGSNSSEASAIRWLLDQLVKEVVADRLLCVQIIRSYLEASGPGGMDQSPRRRAHCTRPAPHAPGTRAGVAGRRAGKGGCHVTHQLRHSLQVRCGCRTPHLPAEPAHALCRTWAARRLHVGFGVGPFPGLFF